MNWEYRPISTYNNILSDNQSAIQVNHIRLKIGYINDLLRNDEGRVSKIEGEKNLSDIFTKSQDRKRHISNVIGLNLHKENDEKRNKISK